MTNSVAPADLAASMAVIGLRGADRRADSSETAELVGTGAEAFRSVIPRNPECRFDHGRIEAEPLRGFDFDQSLGSLFDRLRVDELRLPGFDWARKVRCEDCAVERGALHVDRGPVRGRCAACGGRMVRLVFFTVGTLERASLSQDELSRPLADAGLGAGDVVLSGSPLRGVLLGDPHAAAAESPSKVIRAS